MILHLKFIKLKILYTKCSKVLCFFGRYQNIKRNFVKYHYLHNIREGLENFLYLK